MKTTVTLAGLLCASVTAKEQPKNSIFYGITEDELLQPNLLEQGLADVASRGFESVNLDTRNLRTGCTSARFRDALKVACAKARSLGLGVILAVAAVAAAFISSSRPLEPDTAAR